MEKQQKSRKPLVVGILAVVVVLAVLVALLLTQCTGGRDAGKDKTGDQTTTAPQSAQSAGYTLYWNLDKELYDGKSEAGMSSREPEDDGMFHIRFFKEGEIVTLKAADRKIVNTLEVHELMGLEFDDNGVIVGVIPLEDMPIQKLGWQFYVQSVGGKIIKVNSSNNMQGMEVMAEMTDATIGIWDMTGISGDMGCDAELIYMDRVYMIGDENGNLTHVYIYDRSEFMRTHDAECQHCGKVVTWYEWTKDTAAPTNGGHYQLQNDIQETIQAAMVEDAQICLDLNGHTIHGANNRRVYSLHNPGTMLAIMDTSEGQKGALKGYSTASDQGGIVWCRYGVAYLYSGTLDASKMVSKLNGTAVDVAKNAYFYMNGGTIIGGTAQWQYNASTNKYTYGLGGAVSVGGKFVLNEGTIKNGKATAIEIIKDGAYSYQRGIGGNIIVYSGAEFEMNGGLIMNGTAGQSGGNIYLDGTSVMTMNGGTIYGGRVTGKGRNGGNVFVTSKATFNFYGGEIKDGVSYNCAANLYLNGTVNMGGGYISGGKIYDWTTKKLNPTSASRNVFSVQGDFYMSGGYIYGGFQCIDTDAEKNPTIVVLSGLANIFSDVEGGSDLYLSYNKDTIDVYVGQLQNGTKIGVNASTGVFTFPCDESNVDSFYSNVPNADVVWTEEGLAIGRAGCICGVNTDNPEDHLGECDGTKVFFAPWTSTTLPTQSGNYYLVKNLDNVSQGSLAKDADVHFDLNGFAITAKSGFRAFSLHNTGAKLSICDSSAAKTGTVITSGTEYTQGNAVWVRYGEFTLYSGTLDGSRYTLHTKWDTGKDGVHGTADDTVGTRDGGTVAMGTNTVFNMYGGKIIGNTMEKYTDKKTVDGVEITKDMPSANGAALALGTGKFTMYGGTIEGGKTEGSGGSIYVNGAGQVEILGGKITGGEATGNGGSVRFTSGAASFAMYGGTIEKGVSHDNGGNLWGNCTMTIVGGTIQNGTATKGGGNILNNGGTLTLLGGTIQNGTVINNGEGGNVKQFNNVNGKLTIGGDVYITGGTVFEDTKHIKANVSCTIGSFEITGGEIDGYVYVGGSVDLKMSGAPVITGGDTNLYLAGAKIIDVTSALEDGANVGITATLDAPFASGAVSEADLAKFTSDAGADKLFQDGMLYLLSENPHLHCVCGGTMEGVAGHTCVDVLFAPYTYGALGASGSFYLADDVTATSQVSTNGYDINLCLNGHNLTNASGLRTFGVKEGTTMIITTCQADKIDADTGYATNNSIITSGRGNQDGTALWLIGNGEVIMYAGTLNGLNHTMIAHPDGDKSGGVVKLNGGNTKFTMYNGTIIGGTMERGHGGAIDANGSIEMFNGKIVGGTMADGNNCTGGAIRLYGSGSFVMHNGLITGGKTNSKGHGGAVKLMDTSVFTLKGGVVEKGETLASTNGGNFSVDHQATLEVQGGTIQNGKSANIGGNIHLCGKLIMSGGKITGGMIGTDANKESGNIAGVGTSAYIDISGGEITGAIGAASAGLTIKVSGKAVLSQPTASTGNRVYLKPLDANGTPNITFIVGDLDDAASIMVTTGYKAFDGSNISAHGKIGVAAEGYTITDQDLAQFVGLWTVSKDAVVDGPKVIKVQNNELWIVPKT